MLDRVWSDWANDVGGSTKLSTILAKDDCYMVVGNPWCDASSKPSETPVCNAQWHNATMARYCGDSFDTATLNDLVATQTWPSDTEQDKGIATLWYNSVNMQKHAPKPFYLYIANQLNTTAVRTSLAMHMPLQLLPLMSHLLSAPLQGMNVVHNALYSRNYGKFAELAGFVCTCDCVSECECRRAVMIWLYQRCAVWSVRLCGRAQYGAVSHTHSWL